MKRDNINIGIVMFVTLIAILLIGFLSLQSSVQNMPESSYVTISHDQDNYRTKIGSYTLKSSRPIYDNSNPVCQIDKGTIAVPPEPDLECWNSDLSFAGTDKTVTLGNGVTFIDYMTVTYDSIDTSVTRENNGVYDMDERYQNMYTVTLDNNFMDISINNKINNVVLLNSDNQYVTFNLYNDFVPFDGTIVANIKYNILNTETEQIIIHSFKIHDSSVTFKLPTDTLGKIEIEYIFTHNILPDMDNIPFGAKNVQYTVVADEIPEQPIQPIEDNNIVIIISIITIIIVIVGLVLFVLSRGG